jgi:hypothetical protein
MAGQDPAAAAADLFGFFILFFGYSLGEWVM